MKFILTSLLLATYCISSFSHSNITGYHIHLTDEELTPQIKEYLQSKPPKQNPYHDSSMDSMDLYHPANNRNRGISLRDFNYNTPPYTRQVLELVNLEEEFIILSFQEPGFRYTLNSDGEININEWLPGSRFKVNDNEPQLRFFINYLEDRKESDTPQDIFDFIQKNLDKYYDNTQTQNK